MNLPTHFSRCVWRWLLRSGLVLCVLLPSFHALAQTDTVNTKRAAPLRDGPSDSAGVLASLPAQTALTRQADRAGPWLQVRTSAGLVGWVHMFDLGNNTSSSDSQSAVGNAASGFLRGVTSFFNKGGSPTPRTTAATSSVGIRGLDAQDLANAQPDVNRVAQMETYRLEAMGAQQFASSVGWQKREVAALAEPGLFGSPRSSSTPNNNFGGESR